MPEYDFHLLQVSVARGVAFITINIPRIYLLDKATEKTVTKTLPKASTKRIIKI
jgi:hypothetical protein